MIDNTKMLQMVLDGQGSINKSLIVLRQDMKKGFENVDKRFDDLESRLTKRIDKIGLQIAALEDDTPTLEEFDGLKKQVQHHLALD